MAFRVYTFHAIQKLAQQQAHSSCYLQAPAFVNAESAQGTSAPAQILPDRTAAASVPMQQNVANPAGTGSPAMDVMMTLRQQALQQRQRTANEIEVSQMQSVAYLCPDLTHHPDPDRSNHDG